MRLYYDNSYLTLFEAQVTQSTEEGRRVYLDKTAFYPTSGGQLHDLGTLNGVAVVDVIDEGDTIAHVLAEPLSASNVTGQINWTRRFDHMQQHSGQHLLSSVFPETTVSVHLGLETSTLDLASPTADLAAAEARVNELIFENHPLTVTFEDAETAQGLRKATERTGQIRIVTIGDLDRSACGGTHVRSTAEIGPIVIRKTEKVRGNLRVHFLCGHRALAFYRSQAALVLTQAEALKETEKRTQKQTEELANLRGRVLFSQSPDGRLLLTGPITDETRALAAGFTAQGPATMLVISENPPAILLASNTLHCGNALKPLLAAHQGKGGGGPTLAQGSLPSADALQSIAAEIGF